MDAIKLHRVNKWMDAVVVMAVILGVGFMGWLATVTMKDSPTNKISHPSLMGQPTLNLTFQGSITKVLTSDGIRIKMDPEPMTIVLPRNMGKSIDLTLIGTSGEIVEVTGSIKKYTKSIEVEFGKTGEVVLIINVDSKHRISFIQKT